MNQTQVFDDDAAWERWLAQQGAVGRMYCLECDCTTNHTTREHREQLQQQEEDLGDLVEDGDVDQVDQDVDDET